MRMTRIKCILSFLFFLTAMQLHAQIKADGYMSLMPSWYYVDQMDQGLWDNVLHNRINMSYDFSDSFVGVLQVRNRLISGQTLKEIPGYKALIQQDEGALDMSFNPLSGDNYVLNTTIDRLWLDWYAGDFQARAGRQRINWGQAMVWNPNDLFNAYSFFDFDYPERPGIDGIRLQLFTGMASRVEAVIKMDRSNRKTMAMLYRFNAGRYDWQVLGGRLNDEDWTAGLGWSGQIGDAGFYGEGTFLIPDARENDEALIASLGGNYTFENSLQLRGEALYSSNLPKKLNTFTNFLTGEASVRSLSVARYSCFASVQYPFTPLFSGTLSAMVFPGNRAWYVGPSWEYSLDSNLYLSMFLNFFRNNPADDEASIDFQGALRLKWHF
ncbi:MAG: hypothetical protein ACOCV9_06850 [Marinilabiliaceae bacterium]